jgi:hypothetical protein
LLQNAPLNILNLLGVYCTFLSTYLSRCTGA